MLTVRARFSERIVKTYVEYWSAGDDNLYGWESQYLTPEFAQAASKRSGAILLAYLDELTEDKFVELVTEFFIRYGHLEM